MSLSFLKTVQTDLETKMEAGFQQNMTQEHDKAVWEGDLAAHPDCSKYQTQIFAYLFMNKPYNCLINF